MIIVLCNCCVIADMQNTKLSSQIRHVGNLSVVKTQEDASTRAKCATSTPTVL